MAHNCNICGKPLTDPISIKRGMGPDCWASRIANSRADKTANLFSNQANYSWGIDDTILWLKDNGGPGRSLTNDMENALARIQAELDKPINAFTIIYLDSDGCWDGVRLTKFDLKMVLVDVQWLLDGRYPHYWSQGLDIDFVYIGEKTYEAAKAKALAT